MALLLKQFCTRSAVLLHRPSVATPCFLNIKGVGDCNRLFDSRRRGFNGCDVRGLTTKPFYSLLPKAAQGFVIKAYFLLVRGRHRAKTRQSKDQDNELEYRVPMIAVSAGDIKMRVTSNNIMIISVENKERGIFYQDFVRLPDEGNFEKAYFKTKLEEGDVVINIKNFKREKVPIYFN